MKLRVTRIIIFCALLSIVLSCSFLYVDNVNIQHVKQDGAINQATSDFRVANSQDEEPEQLYSTTYGGPNSDSCTAMINTSDGGFAFVGRTQSYGGTDQDGWFVRTDSVRNPLWNVSFGGSQDDYFTDVVECSDGGFAIIGVTKSYGAGGEDVWFIKTDGNGTHLWNKTYGSTTNDRGLGLVECSTGGFALAAYYIGGMGGWDGWLIRTNDTGDVEWTHSYGSYTDDRFEDIIECANGDFVLAGWAGILTGEEYWFVRTNSVGTQIWSRYYNGPDAERCQSVVECNDGGFALIGWTRSYGAGDTDIWLVRTSSLGLSIWTQTYGGPGSDGASGIVEKEDGGFVIAGSTSNWGEGNNDAWIINVNSTGYQLWNTTRGGIEGDGASSIVILDSWTYMVAGNTLSFGAGNQDAWMMCIQPPQDLWNYTMGTTDQDAPTEIIECSNGGYAIVGATYTDAYDGQIWLLRVNSTGHELWKQYYAGSELYIERCIDIVQCSDGGFALAGRYHNDAWLLRVDINGTLMWAKSFKPQNGWTWFNSIIACDDGGFAMTGPYYNSSSYLMWVVKTNSTGDTEWIEFFDPIGGATSATGYDIIECSDHGFAVAGIYERSGFTNGLSGCLLRLHSNGTEFWSQFYDDVNDDYLSSIALLENGDFVLSGWTDSKGAADRNGWLIRTDDSGNIIWDYTYGSDGSDTFSSLKKCTGDSLAVVATTNSYGAGDTDIWFLRFNLDGTLLWQETYGGSNDDYGSDFCESSDGGYVLCGSTTSFGVGGYDVYYLRIMPLHWIEAPHELVIEYGYILEYDLSLFADYGMHHIEFEDIANFSIANNYTIRNATNLSPGSYISAIKIVDTFGDYIRSSFVCTVEASAPPMWVQDPEDQVVEFGDLLHYNLNASDISGIDLWTLNDTDHFGIDDNGIITSLYQLPVGTYGLQVSVSDSLNNIQTAIFEVTIIDSTAPTWDQIPMDQVLEFGTPFLYDLNATDLSSISEYYVNDTTNFQIDVNGNLMNATLLSTGAYVLEVRAYDPYGLYCSSEITVLIEDTTAPIWKEVPQNRVAEFGDLFRYNVNASDLSGIDYYMLNDTTYFQIDDSTGVITNHTILVPVGIYRIEVRAFDPYGHYCSADLTIVIQDTTTPVWVIIPENQNVEYGSEFTYNIEASDLSGIHHYWINDSVHFSIDGFGVLTNDTILEPGSYEIQVRAYDYYDNYCFATFVVTVVPPAITTSTTTTSTVTSSITTTTTSTVTSTPTSPTTSTTSPPPTDGMILIVIIIVGVGITAIVVIIIILKRSRTS